MHMISLLILFIIFFTGKATSDPKLLSLDHLSISCGSAAPSTAFNGREWLPDLCPKFSSSITLQGSSTQSSVEPELTVSIDPVPYNTARFSHSQFSYKFLLNSGQKFIRLHFNPTSYKGFHRFYDFFSVEAGPFTLLANFSASLTADALAVATFVKEFCIIIQDNQPLTIVFTPSISASKYTYAFINGIEVISVPPTLDYCHGGDIGVQVVGHKSVIYVDNTTALEMVHRQNIKWGSVSSGDDITAMFGMWGTIVKAKGNKVNNMTWRISVDVGFRYLVRIHFCELGLRMVETGLKDFILIINQIIVSTSTDILQERGNQSMLWYKNYMVIVDGDKREGKRDIFISLKSNHVFLDRDGPLEGFEVFKLSNHDYSLSSPNPLPPIRDSPFQTLQIVPSLLGRRNAIATVIFAAICLVNIIVHMLRQSLGASFTEEEEKKPSPRAQRLCRIFSLAEIQSVTDNFHDSYIIGKGGFGKVYKALIDNGQETVAIKRLKADSNQGKREFWTEIETLSELRHFNLVPLIGYCNEQGEMMLVYEYMSCGTLADHLYKLARKNNAYHLLSWKQRLQICIGAGRGLDYLHTGNGIIHRDVKASNILLDEKFVAKVSDFGLAKTGSGSDSQSQASTNLKGTFGYIDPDYFRTRKLTTKSDVYSFGVVLLEVLCGRQAVEPWVAEERRSLTMWAQDNISKGQVEKIVTPALREEVSPDSLKTFVRIAGKCLLDEPKKRPAMTRVVLKLEFALEQQENAESLAPKERVILSDVYPSTDKPQKENMNLLLPNGRTNVANVLPHKDSEPNEITDLFDAMPNTNKKQDEQAKSFSPNANASTLSGGGRTILSVSTGLAAASPNVKNATSLLRSQNYSNMISSGMKDERKSMIQKLSRKFWPWDAPWRTGKSLKKKNLFRHALSAPLQHGTRKMNLSRSTASGQRIGSNDISSSNLRIFSFSELKAATKSFSKDTVIGSGGFGIVYKGCLKEGSTAKSESGSNVAIKKLRREGLQGFKEWQSEVIFLGKLSHPNLVKLLGYCWTDEELLLVYEFMEKGSLEVPIFTWNSAVEPLPWDIRLNILIGAARGLAFLHAYEPSVIFRDFKPSNILLDESYGAKITDFGFAKSGPMGDHTHVSTQVMGTYGYAAPEYIATGHLTTKSDVYSFGVVLLEMLTGLRAMDKSRPSRQQSLVVWMKSYLVKTNKLEKVMDPRLEGRYPTKSASEVAQLALKCLESNNKRRPSMQEVVEALERIDSAVEKPPRRPRVHF